MREQNKHSLLVAAREGGNEFKNKHRKDTTNTFQKKFNRDLLPLPLTYYSNIFPGLKIKSEWVVVRCCFHEDARPSLNLHLMSGRFHCFGCGARGGDVLAFHRRYYGLTFMEACHSLEVWS